MFDSIFIYIPEMKQIVKIAEGSGDNLTNDDIDSGYVDYIYYDTYAMDTDIRENDGGMIMLTELFQKKFTCTADAIPYVLDMVYSNESLKYILLD